MVYRYLITPVSKPRMTRSDKWKKRPCVVRYFDYKDELLKQSVRLPLYGASVTFLLPMPKTWSKKKKEKFRLKPHMQKPDLDNLLKGLQDAIFDNDCMVWHYKELMKQWHDNGAIIIEY